MDGYKRDECKRNGQICKRIYGYEWMDGWIDGYEREGGWMDGNRNKRGIDEYEWDGWMNENENMRDIWI